MIKIRDEKTSTFFGFLADTLSNSSLFTPDKKDSGKTAEASKADVKPKMSDEEYFTFLGNTLFISRLVA